MKNQDNVFEDFEFKPITEGLGFHPRSETKDHALASNKESLAIETITKSQAESIQPPLPRKAKTNTKIDQASKTQKTVDEILQTLNTRKSSQFPDIYEDPALATSKSSSLYKPSTWEFAAGIIDFMLVIALQIACLMIVMTVTNTRAETLLTTSDMDYALWFALLTQLGGISFIYLVVCRSFLGFTAGEWVFDQRLGLPSEQKQLEYIFKVATRSLVVVITGFILFPFLSLLFNKDVLGESLGIPLLKRS